MESKQEPVLDDLPDPDLKIILLGDSAVGKSKLIERYLMDEYNPRQVQPAGPKPTRYAYILLYLHVC
jgi:Rab-like protein 2